MEPKKELKEKEHVITLDGALLPSLLKAVARLLETNRNITDPEYVFDDKNEELRVLDRRESVDPFLFSILY